MSDASLTRASGYRPSGKCDWLRLLTVALPLSLLGACALAFVLMQLFLWGAYLFIIVPLAAGLLLGLLTAYLLRVAHCRNPYVAGGFGVLLASVMYLGYFHCHFVSIVGWPGLTRIDFLPAFINARMQNDVVEKIGDVGQREKKPVAFFNWLWCGADCFMAVAMCRTFAVKGARRAYCETCQRWMIRKEAAVVPGAAQLVAAAIVEKRITSLPELPPVKNRGAFPNAQFELEYCPGREDQAENCLIYLTAGEYASVQKSTVVAQQTLLTTEELAELVQKLKFK
jgi:hypothetical protein